MKYSAHDVKVNISDIKRFGEYDALLRKLSLDSREVSDFVIERRSLDSRFHESKGIFYVYTVSFESPKVLRRKDISPAKASAVIIPQAKKVSFRTRPVIVGSGPAGLFCALRLTEHGIAPMIIEKGKDIPARAKDVEDLMGNGILDLDSNIQFGLGGAGTFSDGKLRTRIKSPFLKYVMENFVRFGAERSILYEAKPHIGTDKLRGIVSAIKSYLADNGCEFRFSTALTDISTVNGRISGIIVNDSEEIVCDKLVIAAGNAARDIFTILYKIGTVLTAKPMAVGVRVEHDKEIIDRYNYGRYCGDPILPVSDCTLTYKDTSGRGVYTFCSCPGGYVINSSTEEGLICVNGMSYSDRGNHLTNSAFVVSVTPQDYPGTGPLAGVEFQRLIERAAFEKGPGGYIAPSMSVADFMNISATEHCEASIMPGTYPADITQILPEIITGPLRNAFDEFRGKILGFECGMITAPETRTSSPVRIDRDRITFMSVSTEGLYPIGEGAGYAGGIVSSAVDGAACAEAIAYAAEY